MGESVSCVSRHRQFEALKAGPSPAYPQHHSSHRNVAGPKHTWLYLAVHPYVSLHCWSTLLLGPRTPQRTRIKPRSFLFPLGEAQLLQDEHNKRALVHSFKNSSVLFYPAVPPPVPSPSLHDGGTAAPRRIAEVILCAPEVSTNQKAPSVFQAPPFSFTTGGNGHAARGAWPTAAFRCTSPGRAQCSKREGTARYPEHGEGVGGALRGLRWSAGRREEQPFNRTLRSACSLQAAARGQHRPEPGTAGWGATERGAERTPSGHRSRHSPRDQQAPSISGREAEDGWWRWTYVLLVQCNLRSLRGIKNEVS